ncbi:hypothetical protein FGSG_11972 [Fusarium graminearum PH-1]|uniref:Chromosome 1, complete genome n=1 Tax=Gibberella zeae (strain ATCC MYA-4620 / CBS 123657 / FGSC 9075 / NRRL 31084 / PH-1) TaxID=229533 RepID=I1S554_GIBZE|nr:hypothetical protein FGSG_11972 [Fusarium graminearum PH-1]ESU06924.1 hypothetical protein FGSG_11972 [Fusarium graminearum PH-1]CEF73750.1 unnamed protein product [Fusarium graminearum]|eukprot:XP_011317409.1 hypothetical protein FGSG_11972 [Fusarium graminearum PH-1]
MPSKKPNIGNLLALLEMFLALQLDILPGGTATIAELDFAEKDSPIKREDRPVLLQSPEHPRLLPSAATAATAAFSAVSVMNTTSPGPRCGFWAFYLRGLLLFSLERIGIWLRPDSERSTESCKGREI